MEHNHNNQEDSIFFESVRNLANIYKNKKKFDLMIKSYKFGVKFNDIYCMKELAKHYECIGLTQKSIKYYQKIISTYTKKYTIEKNLKIFSDSNTNSDLDSISGSESVSSSEFVSSSESDIKTNSISKNSSTFKPELLSNLHTCNFHLESNYDSNNNLESETYTDSDDEPVVKSQILKDKGRTVITLNMYSDSENESNNESKNISDLNDEQQNVLQLLMNNLSSDSIHDDSQIITTKSNQSFVCIFFGGIIKTGYVIIDMDNTNPNIKYSKYQKYYGKESEGFRCKFIRTDKSIDKLKEIINSKLKQYQINEILYKIDVLSATKMLKEST